jgi:hypothetical protein
MLFCWERSMTDFTSATGKLIEKQWEFGKDIVIVLQILKKHMSL